jgi:hypothetical protein
MPPDQTTIAQKMIQFDMVSYQSFFDHDWSRTTLDRVKGTRLEDAVSNLCVLWKSSANTHHLPALATRVLAAMSEGYIRGVDPYSAKFFDRFADLLIERMKGGLTVTKRHELRREIMALGQNFRLNEQIQALSVDAWWERLTQHGEMHLSMVGVVSLCFCEILFAYEAFIVDCYALLGLDTKHRISGDRFWPALETVIPGAKATYWTDDYITMARETRNCIAHRGNKAKPELLAAISKIPEGPKRIFVGPDNDISVMAADNHYLFDVLKGKVSCLVGEVLPRL